MFISYKYLGCDQCKIIDTDFEEVVLSAGVGAAWATIAVIKVYEKRNLNVAANIALLFQHQHSKFIYKISDLINYNKQYNKKYLKYADKVDQLMIWI